MTSTVHGAVKYIQSNATPNAVYSPCSNHCLNLSISKSSSVMSIKNSVGIIKETVKFFNMSAKRNFVLKKVFGKEKHLMSLCETRWTERHDSILIFKNFLQYIIKSLNLITEWQDNDSSVKAYSLLNSLTTCEFIISLFTLSDLLYLTSPASKLLQGIQNDLNFAEDCFKDIINVMVNRRSNSDIHFKTIFEESKKLMEKLDVELKLPPITKHQIHRPNILSVSIEEYFRISVYNVLYDHVLDDLKNRYLSKKNLTVYKLLLLIPKSVVDIKSDDINYIAEIVDKEYSYLHIEKQYLTSELELWIAKWTRVKNEGKYKIYYLFF